jgi:hypothetical protein
MALSANSVSVSHGALVACVRGLTFASAYLSRGRGLALHASSLHTRDKQGIAAD